MYIDLTNKNLTKTEKNEIEKLLQRQDKNIKTDLKQQRYLMDLVWDDFGCDSKKLDSEKINKFYSHPIWLLHGLFVEQDNVSMGHRNAISQWILKNKFKIVIDYGGGFGTLARLIAKGDKDIRMNIYEPYPSEFGLRRAGEYTNIKIIREFESNYDCLISEDVLEHIPDPLTEFSKMINVVKLNGYLVVVNAFYPMIKCHLPQNFHFRYSFNFFAKMMGLKIVGRLKGSPATIFKKVEEKKLNWKKIRFYERLSEVVFPLVEIFKPILRLIKKIIIR